MIIGWKEAPRLRTALLWAALGACAAAPPSATVSAGTTAIAAAKPATSLVALDYAFRFASAIDDDPKDRAKAQELALGAFASVGAYDAAAQRAEAIEGWRRGVVYADLAAELARQGRRDEARAYLEKAESIRAGVTGWQNPRISAHVAEAWALLGETGKSAAITSDLAANDPIQYAGRAAATDAVGQAVQGDFARAFDRLKALEGNNDLDVAQARTQGYLALARDARAPEKQRLAALAAARDSAAKLPIELRVASLLGAASEYAALGKKKEGRDTVKAAVSAVEEGPPSAAGRIPYLVEIGRAWGTLQDPKRARRALESAETLVKDALAIDRPGLLARIASVYRQIGDSPRAEAIDQKAVQAAAEMPLPRPRALSLSAICRQMGLDGVVPQEAVRAQLDALLAGLRTGS